MVDGICEKSRANVILMMKDEGLPLNSKEKARMYSLIHIQNFTNKSVELDEGGKGTHNGKKEVKLYF